MAPIRYKSVRLPEPLLERVEQFVKQNDLGFTTTPEVLKQATREFLERHAA